MIINSIRLCYSETYLCLFITIKEQKDFISFPSQRFFSSNISEEVYMRVFIFYPSK